MAVLRTTGRISTALAGPYRTRTWLLREGKSCSTLDRPGAGGEGQWSHWGHPRDGTVTESQGTGWGMSLLPGAGSFIMMLLFAEVTPALFCPPSSQACPHF